MRDEAAKKFEVFCETYTNKEFDPKKILSNVIKEVDHKPGRKNQYARTKQMGGEKNPHYVKRKLSISRNRVLEYITNLNPSGPKISQAQSAVGKERINHLLPSKKIKLK